MASSRITRRSTLVAALVGAVVAVLPSAATPQALAIPTAPALPAASQSTLTAVGTGGGPAGVVDATELDRRITTLLPKRLGNPRLGDDVSIVVLGSDGETLLHRTQPVQAQMPASNMKLVTALGALTSLGPDTVLTTRVTLREDGPGVVLVGGGDPLLDSGSLAALARRTANALTVDEPPKRVDVHIKDSMFRDPTIAPGWRASYVPGEVTYVRSLARRFAYTTDQAEAAGRFFVQQLRANGVKSRYGGRGAGPLGAEVIRTKGHTVAAAVTVMLRDSDNQVAETLFRHIALAKGYSPTWTGGAAAAMDVLREHGIRTDGVVVHDGSGLSRADRLNATTLTQLLAVVQSGDVPQLAAFVPGLPVAGRTGTLAASNGRYTTEPSRCAAGRVFAKTGTLTGAIALSGFALGDDGNTRAFSVLVNHPPTNRYGVLAVRRAIDGLAATVTGCW